MTNTQQPRISAWQWLLMAAGTLTILSSAPLAPIAPAMADYFSDLPNAVFWVQLVVAAPGVTIALSAMSLGRYVNRCNPPLLLTIALISYSALGLIWLINTKSLVLLIISRILLGLSVAVIMMLTTLLLTHNQSAPRRQQLLGWQAATGSFAAVIYMAMASGALLWHWLAPFSLYGVGALIALLTIVMYGSHQRSKIPDQKTHAQPKIDKSLTPNAAYNETPAKPTSQWLLASCAVVEMLALYAIILHVPFLGIASESWLGAILAITLLTMAIVAANYGRLQRRFNPVQQQLVGLFILSCAFSLLIVTPPGTIGVIYVVVMLAIIGSALGLLRPNLVAWWLGQTPPLARPAIMGKITALFFAAQFCSPFVIYPLVNVGSDKALWAFMGGLCAAMGCMILLTNGQLKRHEPLNSSTSPTEC